jgi:S1-C subfamily serine protease
MRLTRRPFPTLLSLAALAAAAVAVPASPRAADAAVDPAAAKALYNRVSPSLVAVQFVWETELGRRELTGAGVVVSDDGLVATSIGVVDPRIPDAQMKDFKIIVPKLESDHEEVDAVFLGRDERSNLAFLRVKPEANNGGNDSGGNNGDAAKSESSSSKGPRKWTALKFEDVPIEVGEDLLSVGLLPKDAGYKTYLYGGTAAAQLRGEVPMILVNGGLAAVGSPVFNAAGKAVGLVNIQSGQPVFLGDGNPRGNPLQAMMVPPRFFVPTRDFAQSLADPPTESEKLRVPWLGVPQSAMNGLNKDVAEVFGLVGQPAIELGDIIKDSPAAKAGLKSGDVIVKLNGEPLERGDDPDELPDIFVRKLRKIGVGKEITLSVLRGKGQPLTDIRVTLEERPKLANTAERYWAEDLGFGVREIVFSDTYSRRLPADQTGVVVSLIKPNSSAAAAKLNGEDLITELNGKPVANLAEFEKEYAALRKDKPREAVVLVVLRESNTQVIRVEPPQ